jgi:UDP-glucose 4-epimerase
MASAIGADSVCADLTVPSTTRELAAVKPNVIVHCAAVLPFSDEDEAAVAVNRQIDFAVHQLAEASKASLIFCSSLSVYDGRPVPWSEGQVLCPGSLYASSKLDAEHLFSGVSRGAVAMRISSPYGASHLNRRGVLYTFARSAVAGTDLRILGTGERTQDFVHADDVAQAVVCALRYWNEDEGLSITGTINIASGKAVSMKELAMTVLRLADSSSRLIMGGENDPQADYRAEVDISKARQVLNWAPSISLETGLIELIEAISKGK